jgi:hypothetical protein
VLVAVIVAGGLVLHASAASRNQTHRSAAGTISTPAGREVVQTTVELGPGSRPPGTRIPVTRFSMSSTVRRLSTSWKERHQ